MQWILPLVLFFVANTAQAAPFHVVVDPGHGGTDAGAVHYSLKESSIVLEVAEKLRALLQKDKSFRVTMTRESDITIPLSRRTQIAENKKGDFFVSIHINSNNEEKVRGAEFYFQNQLPPDEEALYLANVENQGAKKEAKTDESDVNAILKDLVKTHHLHLSYQFNKELKDLWKKSFPQKSATIKQGPFHVLSEVSIPSALIEIGFLSNPEEAKWLSSSENQQKIAQLLYRSLKRYKEKIDKSVPSRL